MAWSITGSPEVFRSEAGAFVAARPDLHTMLLSGLDTIERLRSGVTAPTARLGWWRDVEGAPTTAAFVWTPPHLLTASSLSQAAAAGLARLLSTDSGRCAGLLADATSVRAFCRVWEAETGKAPADGPRVRLHRLDELVPPVIAPPGTPRVATGDDRPLLRDWCTRFVAEAAHSEPISTRSSTSGSPKAAGGCGRPRANRWRWPP
ncbi:hypothetical protein ACFQ51_47140 [Streptomyces kaempferi]